MNYKEISQLLEKYFEGETSLQEEAQLREYFNGATIHESLRPYQPLFRFFQSEREQKLDTIFEEQLLRQLQKTEQPHLKVRRLSIWMARVAAVALLTIGVWWGYQQMNPAKTAPVAQAIDWSKYEPETPEEAYQVLKTSLKKASTELNQGAATAAEEMSKMRKITEIIQ
ncbi:MAG: hypothetical protein SFU99_20700 [Saprospiraceae bacterium]|nr:hypothetical protein [Saprospiraceae bacterium]